MRKFLALAATFVTIVTLTGCTTQNPADAIMQGALRTCKAGTEHSNVDQIQVSTDQTTAPTVDFASPISSKTTESKVVVEGHGPEILGDQLVNIEYIGIDGNTGKTFQSSKFDGTDFIPQFIKSGQQPDFCGALAGVREGSRVAILLPAELAHGGQGIPDLGVAPTASVIFVFDILKVFLPKALGEEVALPSDFPGINVTRAANGTPGLTIPRNVAPADLKIATLIKGRGEKVAMGKTATLHYTGFLWDETTTIFDSSWDKGQPAQFQLTEGALIKGFLNAVVGQTVGSQVVAIIPPEFGYGNTDQGSIPANSTLIFVIDILGAN